MRDQFIWPKFCWPTLLGNNFGSNSFDQWINFRRQKIYGQLIIIGQKSSPNDRPINVRWNDTREPYYKYRKENYINIYDFIIDNLNVEVVHARCVVIACRQMHFKCAHRFIVNELEKSLLYTYLTYTYVCVCVQI